VRQSITKFFIWPAAVTAAAALAWASGNAGDSVQLDPSMMSNVQIETVKPETMHRVLAATGKRVFAAPIPVETPNASR